ncbi:MAG TPA: TA system VapC family ribonuclease toxin [Xanthobacteraceae bacterium]
MRALFDVNLLIAVIDGGHEHHRKAHEWWSANISDGWATCPLTENGMVRVMSQSGYKTPISTTFAVDLLAEQINKTDHVFWPDDLSLRDNEWIDPDRILGPSQITDAYLLALAVKHGGRLVTFDRGITLPAVHGAEPRHLLVI